MLRQTQKNDIHVVKQARLMRGFDYRSSDGAGIALLICAPFGSKRDLLQALGRVGRTGDLGVRLALCTELVDVNQVRKLAESLAFH